MANELMTDGADAIIAEARKTKETAERMANGEGPPTEADDIRVLAGMVHQIAEQVERLAGVVSGGGAPSPTRTRTTPTPRVSRWGSAIPQRHFPPPKTCDFPTRAVVGIQLEDPILERLANLDSGPTSCDRRRGVNGRASCLSE